jgi:hypothetical protein
MSNFKKQEAARLGRAMREHTARLKSARMARQAAEKKVAEESGLK